MDLKINTKICPQSLREGGGEAQMHYEILMGERETTGVGDWESEIKNPLKNFLYWGRVAKQLF